MRGRATAVRAPRGVDAHPILGADALHRREHELRIEAASLRENAWERVHEADAVRPRRGPWTPDELAAKVETECAVDAFADAVAGLAVRAARLEEVLCLAGRATRRTPRTPGAGGSA